jgi:putative hydrolase of the HAD superfamily
MLRAVTLDLDDTLWAIAPVVLRAEQALHAWLAANCPRVAARYSLEAMRALREQVARENPHLAHDFTAQRRLSLAAAIRACDEDELHVDAAFDAFFCARNQVDLYPEVAQALARITRCVPVAALTNGNADLGRIGLTQHFRFTLGAREFGAAKPDPAIFRAACERLGCAPGEVLHVGDDPEMDVVGARRAGLRAAWLHRGEAGWSHHPEHAPERVLRHLGELADWVEHETRHEIAAAAAPRQARA